MENVLLFLLKDSRYYYHICSNDNSNWNVNNASNSIIALVDLVKVGRDTEDGLSL